MHEQEFRDDEIHYNQKEKHTIGMAYAHIEDLLKNRKSGDIFNECVREIRKGFDMLTPCGLRFLVVRTWYEGYRSADKSLRELTVLHDVCFWKLLMVGANFYEKDRIPSGDLAHLLIWVDRALIAHKEYVDRKTLSAGV